MASLKERPESTAKPWTVRWRDQGRNRRRSFARKGEATAWLEKALAIEREQKDSSYGVTTALYRRTLADHWLQWQRGRSHLSQSVQEKDRSVWNAWVQPTLGHRRLGTITHRDLSALLARVTEAGRGMDTRIAVYQRVCMVMDDALGHEGHTCRRAVAGTPRRQRKIRLLSNDETDRLLEAIPDEWRLYVDTLATLGLRPGEGLKLTGGDIVDGEVTVRATKNDVTRTLPLPARLATALQDRAHDVGADARLWDIPDFRGWRRRVFKPACDEAGLGGLVPYDLRHTVASRLISKGATPVDVASWMGHSEQMTLRVYGHLFPGRKAELAAMLDR